MFIIIFKFIYKQTTIFINVPLVERHVFTIHLYFVVSLIGANNNLFLIHSANEYNILLRLPYDSIENIILQKKRFIKSLANFKTVDRV